MVDNLIRLFDSAETEFTSNGIGVLSDAESCVITEERNGAFELSMVYPITGKRFSEIVMRRIIVAKSNPYSTPQPFRIYSITKPFNGRVTVNAEHISYDMSGYPVSPFEAKSCIDAFDQMKANSAAPCPFTFWTDKDVTKDFATTKPMSMRSLLGGTDGSILSVFGKGDYEFDLYTVRLYVNRGADRGVFIRYGKNLTDIKQEENCTSVYTGVYPYWYSENNGKPVIVTLPEKVVNGQGTYNYNKILTLDMSDKFTDKPKVEDLRSAAEDYIKNNNIGVPSVSLDISFEQLAQTKEYEQYAMLEEVRLCDTVHVEFPALCVSAEAQCIKTEYDVLTDKYKKLELGSSKTNLASTIANQEKALFAPLAQSYLGQVVERATQLISGNAGGYVIMRNSDGGKQPNEILIMDTPDVNTAKKVWRWNQSGLGYSKNGINGPYGLAMTIDGEISADFITTGVLNAISIRACDIKCGTLTEGAGQAYEKYYFELSDDGTLKATKGQVAGFTIDDKSIHKGIDEMASTENSGIYMGTDGIRLGESFAVDIDGNLRATSGVIAGFTIDDKSIHKGIDEMDSEATSGIYLGPDGIRLGAKESFSVNTNGEMIATSGKIAGLIIQEETRYVDSMQMTGAVLKSEDDNLVIFSGKDSSGRTGSIVKVDSIDIVEPIFDRTVYSTNLQGGNTVQGGDVKLYGSWLMCNDERVILLDYSSKSDTVRATISNSSMSQTITIRLTDVNGDPYVTKESKTFQLKLHRTLSKWVTTSITIPIGSSSVSRTVDGAFWGYDEAQFVNSGSNIYEYSTSSRKYVDFNRNIEPYSNATFDCGSSDYKWNNIWASTPTIETSDRAEKFNIFVIDDKFGELFDRLKPVTYKFKNNTSNRTHIGFIAQDIKESLDEIDLSSRDFAAYCEYEKLDGTKGYGVRYGEFVALNTYEIQKLKKRVAELEEQIGK